ncbi:transketolase [bacterium]|nr:transketolase [bacterium]
MTYEDILKELALNDDRYVIMTAENRAPIRNLPSVLGPRFIDTGITEQTMIGAAAGLALRGCTVITHALATFLTLRAFEFIRTDIGIGNLPIKMTGFVPGILSDGNGPTHQALEDVSLMRGIPHVNIFCPADEDDMIVGLKTIVESPSPFYIRYNALKSVYTHDRRFEIGKAEVISRGSDVTLLTYGALFNQVYDAMNILESKGVSVRVINLRTLKPIDEKAILNAAVETPLIVTIEDHFLTGGLYSIVAELFLKHRVHAARVVPIAFEHRWFKPALLHNVLEHERLTGKQLAERIEIEIQKTETETFAIPSLAHY